VSAQTSENAQSNRARILIEFSRSKNFVPPGRERGMRLVIAFKPVLVFASIARAL
jgi:hypothetical protein